MEETPLTAGARFRQTLVEEDAMSEVMPFASVVGVEVTAATPTEVRGRLPWAPERCTTGRVLHGGALMALADSLGAVCAILNVPPGAGTTTVESKTNFFRALTEGEALGVTRPLHVGRRFIVVQTEITDTAGRRVAQVTQTQAVLESPAGAPEPPAATEVGPPADLPPTLAVLNLATGVWTAQALWTAACLGVADHLADGPKTREELAALTQTLPGPLGRVLRALACLGVFKEGPDGRFASTPRSETLRSDAPGSLRDFVVFLGQPWHVAAYGELLHPLRTGEPAIDRVVGKPIWEFLAADPEASRVFNAGMSGVIAETAEAVRDAFDFSTIRTLVDVGGGHGTLLGTILAANPHLHGVLFDLPHVVDGAAATFDRLGVRARARVAGGDFFHDVPCGDAYILSHIIHDWDDERSTAILRAIRRAAEPEARVLVVETVIPPGNTYSFGKLLDLEMLALPGGIERTEAEYRALLAAGGFRMTRIVPTRSFASIVAGVVA
jgi:uncharacterized protein (TIGR00369 family)